MYIQQLGFGWSQDNVCVFAKKVNEHFIYIILYVDDMSLDGTNMDLIKEVRLQLSSKFDMKDLDAANFILGVKIKRDWTKKKQWLN